jgi:hypothetical protein
VQAIHASLPDQTVKECQKLSLGGKLSQYWELALKISRALSHPNRRDLSHMKGSLAQKIEQSLVLSSLDLLASWK